MYKKDPMGIENESMSIIEEVMDDVNFSEEEKLVVKRMIHTTGDLDYRHIVDLSNDFLEEAKKALEEGVKIYTDTKMAYQGINKTALAKSACDLYVHISDEDVAQEAKKRGTTRSIVAIEKAVANGAEAFVIGNAPTALYRLLELAEEGRVKPKFIVAVPVGFVGAAESKEEVAKYDYPYIRTRGNKGGSNVAASIINALLYMVYPR
ncbi:MAG: precorrin-8X methylmutase [Tissierellia bacterium]|nr:precorrin-8X methylmutase [Tissierellia bacterium]